MKSSNNPLTVKAFKLLWIGESVSILGDQFALIALPWLILQLTGSSVALASVLALMAIPRAVFMLIGGVVIDKYSPKKVMLITSILRMLLIGTLALCIGLNLIQYWMIYIFAFLFGLGDAFYLPAQNSLVPHLVSKEQLQMANTLLQGMGLLAALFGPILAGLIIGSVAPGQNNMKGIMIALFIDTLSFLATIICTVLIQIKEKLQLGDEEKNVWESIKEGAEYVWHKPVLRTMLLVVMVINFFILGPFEIGIPVLAQSLPDGSATVYGFIMAAFGAGGLVGILLSGILPTLKPKLFGPMIMILIALQGVTLATMPFIPNVLVIMAISLVMGITNGYVNLVAFTWLQKITPEKLMGRVLSLVMFASLGLVPISNMLAGFVITINLNLLFAAAGIITAVFCISLAPTRVVRSMGEI